jgi:hypothetical protein
MAVYLQEITVMGLSEIQKRRFLETCGMEYEGEELQGQFLTRRAFNDDKWEKLSPWIFSYVIEPDTGYLICELDHKMSNNRIFGWDRDGNELPKTITNKYFEPHY